MLFIHMFIHDAIGIELLQGMQRQVMHSQCAHMVLFRFDDTFVFLMCWMMT